MLFASKSFLSSPDLAPSYFRLFGGLAKRARGVLYSSIPHRSVATRIAQAILALDISCAE